MICFCFFDIRKNVSERSAFKQFNFRLLLVVILYFSAIRNFFISQLWAETLDEAYKWMKRIDKFEQKHFPLRLEYRVIGDLMNRMKESSGKNRFLLQQKLNRAIRLVDWKEAYDPNNPANYGVIHHEQLGTSEDLVQVGFEKEKQIIQGRMEEDDDVEIDDMKEKDDILLEKLNGIDKILEEKLAELDQTFGKKGKVLEEEIRNLAEERNELTEKRRRPLYRIVSICFSSLI